MRLVHGHDLAFNWALLPIIIYQPSLFSQHFCMAYRSIMFTDGRLVVINKYIYVHDCGTFVILSAIQCPQQVDLRHARQLAEGQNFNQKVICSFKIYSHRS